MMAPFSLYIVVMLVWSNIASSQDSIMSIEDIFRFRLDDVSNDTARSYATDLEKNGYFKIDNILSTQATQQLAEILSKSKIAESNSMRNAWQCPTIDKNYPMEHPINHLTLGKIGFVGRTDMPKIFIDLYNYPPFLKLFQRILFNLRYDTLHLSADREGSVYGIVSNEGGVMGPHFDQHPFTCVWMLQKALYGSGQFRFSHLPPTVKEDGRFEWDYDLIQRILTKNEAALREHQKEISVNEGDVYCFEGNVSMHEVTPVVGDKQRIIFVTGFHEIENFEHTGHVNENNEWGEFNSASEGERKMHKEL